MSLTSGCFHLATAAWCSRWPLNILPAVLRGILTEARPDWRKARATQHLGDHISLRTWQLALAQEPQEKLVKHPFSQEDWRFGMLWLSTQMVWEKNVSAPSGEFYSQIRWERLILDNSKFHLKKRAIITAHDCISLCDMLTSWAGLRMQLLSSRWSLSREQRQHNITMTKQLTGIQYIV